MKKPNIKLPDVKKVFTESSVFTKMRAVNSTLALGAAGYLAKQGRKREAGLMAAASAVWAAGTVQSFKNDKMRNELKKKQDKNKKNGPK